MRASQRSQKRRKKVSLSNMKKYLPTIRKAISVLLLILWIMFIFGNSTQTADDSSVRSGAIAALFGNILSEHFIRKCAHLFEYTVLGFLIGFVKDSFVGKNKIGMYVSLASGFVIASCDELIQLTSEGRSAQFTDVCIDFAGVALGLLVFWGIEKVIKKI